LYLKLKGARKEETEVSKRVSRGKTKNLEKKKYIHGGPLLNKPMVLGRKGVEGLEMGTNQKEEKRAQMKISEVTPGV